MANIRIQLKLAGDPSQAETVFTVIGARAFALKPEPDAGK
jgi:hypothetical protein